MTDVGTDRPLQASLWRQCHGQGGSKPGPDTTSASSASAIVDRAPDNFHLLALSLSCALVMRKASAVGPGAMLIAWDEIATLSGMH